MVGKYGGADDKGQTYIRFFRTRAAGIKFEAADGKRLKLSGAIWLPRKSTHHSRRKGCSCIICSLLP
jgi:hypothetical protein